MGLDMFLNAQRFLWSSDADSTMPRSKDDDIADAIRAALPEMGKLRPTKVFVEAAYWRKANAIHQWFVANCQGGKDECQESYVGREELNTLLKLVTTVLDNPDQAAALLPTQSGFFFGNTQYDEGYIQDLTYTRDQLTLLLTNEDMKHWEFYYCASW